MEERFSLKHKVKDSQVTRRRELIRSFLTKAMVSVEDFRRNRRIPSRIVSEAGINKALAPSW